MRQKPGGRWLRFTAVEEFEVFEIGFSWQARFPVAPLVKLRVVDDYSAGAGKLEARLWGFLPVMRAAGPETARGQALRYLAELVWVPQAMIANRELEWRGLGDGAVEVGADAGGARVAVRLDFDANGDVVSATTPARSRKDGKTTVETPWGGSFDDYGTIGGVRIPRNGEVRWELPDGPFTYWRGRVTSFERIA
jgi:hypothetical protein